MSKNNQFGGFDPQGLERAAQAVRELSQSQHAGSVLHLQAKEQEAKAEEYRALQKQREINKVKVEQEERRKTLEKNLEINKETAKYNDKLNRKRFEDQQELQAQYQEKQRLKQEEALKREEEIKRQTAEHNLKMEEKKLLMKGKIDAQMYRQNHDLHKEELIMREKERRETLKQIFLLNFDKFQSGFEYLMNNKSLIANFFLYTAAVSTAFYLSRSSILLGMKFIEQRFNKPSLIRETSRLTFKDFYKLPVKMTQNLFQNNQEAQKRIFKNIILNPQLKDSLNTISYSLLNKRKHNAPLRNVMFYGPPGTGKTLFAKQLAYQSGLDYAIMTGADVSPLGSQSVHELHKVFDWANTNSRGMLLFIDEADAFFRKRDKDEISENLRNAINAFLYRTGTPSKKSMIVLATNQPEQLDKALQDRIDQILFFDKPQQKERVDLLFLYFTKYCDPHYRLKEQLIDIWRQPSTLFVQKKVIRFDDDINDEFIRDIASKVDGFSAREIEKFVIACHDKAFSMDDPLLNQELIQQTLESALEQHKQRQEWVEQQ